MTVESTRTRDIEGKGRTIRELLASRKYSIDYYQREYKWQTKQVIELLTDLTAKFQESYDPGHDRSAVADYAHYFLGSIIISDKDGRKFIVDGQQRLTTVTLLLIFLHHQLQDAEHKAQISDLVFSQRFGRRSFNLDIPERAACMDAIYQGRDHDEPDPSESIANILGRYGDIDEVFPKELRGDALPYFTDWLIENVHLVEITAYSDEDAYTIFETMNDRGLSLTPTDMLKGYLLANITDPEDRARASAAWRNRIASLLELGKEEDADGIKAWLRSQYAESIRERKRGAKPRDFDLIGTEFHRWVREHESKLGLLRGRDFAELIERDFSFYLGWYQKLRSAAETLTRGLESVYYNGQHNFTLQYAVILSALRVDDSEEAILKKIRVVAAYLDIYIHRRIWNWHAIDYSTVQYTMFLLMRDIRRMGVVDLAVDLSFRLEADPETFQSNPNFRLHGMNRRQIHRMLARMTEYVEVESGMPSRYLEYSRRGGRDGYEIEHIWANRPERYAQEFPHSSDFQEYRNRIGGLLLLPKSFNASYGDLPYEEKVEHYNGQNLLARSLHTRAYEHNPGFRRFIERTGLQFEPYASFGKAELDARQDLYRRLAELIWNPQRLRQEAMA